MSKSLWLTKRIYPFTLKILNLDHPDIETIVLDEIDSGVDVYYDTRWKITDAFCQFLIKQQELIRNLSVLVLGAGIGMETLVIGQLCKKIYINDMAPLSLDLCAIQLKKNGIQKFEVLPGRYEDLEYPRVDIVIGCYIIYNKETLKAIKRFLNHCPFPVLLMNENNSAFENLLNTSPNKQFLFRDGGYQCILIE